MVVDYKRPLRIAVSIAEPTVIEMQRHMNKVEDFAHHNKSNIEYLIELRVDALDSISDNSLKKLIEHNKVPKIVTIRPKDMKGGFIGNDVERWPYFGKAIDLETEYIDIEIEHYDNFFDLNTLKEKFKETLKTKLILSHHDYERTGDFIELEHMHRHIADKKPDIIKIATMAKSYGDNNKMFNLIRKHARDDNLIGICMGDLGRPSREWGPVYGGFLTFAALSEDKITGPGQYTVEKLLELWKIHRLI